MRTKKRGKTSVSKEMTYQLNDTIPVLSIKGSEIKETPKKLFKGTIVKGFLKKRVVNFGGKKLPFKFIQLKDENGYISTQGVDLYIPLDGFKTSNFDSVPVPVDLVTNKKEEDKAVKSAKTNKLIAYGLPVLTGVLGWQIAKKMEMEFRNKVLISVLCGLIGLVPNYIIKNKQK